MNWDTIPKPAEVAESRLIEAILDGHFAIGERLPAERELATQLGVTRPTLRETLQRLARDGWIDIQQGRATRVRNFWQEGNLGVLGAIAGYPDHVPDDFVPNLLQVRKLMAPTYTRLAAERAPEQVIDFLRDAVATPDEPGSFAAIDWEVHHKLTVLSGNPIFTLILNGFKSLYVTMAGYYFLSTAARAHSRAYYQELAETVRSDDLPAVEELVEKVMESSLIFWNEAAAKGAGHE